MTTEQTQNPVAEVLSEAELLAQRVSASRMSASRVRAYRKRVISWLLSEFRPPDPWSKGSPPLADTWRYVVHGEHLPPQGLARLLAIGYGAVVCLPLRTVLAVLDWIIERPARMVVCLALLALFAQTPYGSFIPRISE